MIGITVHMLLCETFLSVSSRCEEKYMLGMLSLGHTRPWEKLCKIRLGCY